MNYLSDFRFVCGKFKDILGYFIYCDDKSVIHSIWKCHLCHCCSFVFVFICHSQLENYYKKKKNKTYLIILHVNIT